MKDEIWEKITGCEMLLIGIGSQLERKKGQEEAVDAAYQTLARLLQGRNFFVVTGNTDQKLQDGTILGLLSVSLALEGQEKQWKAYQNWLGCTLTHSLTILELGEGFGNPQMMRWPFEKIALLHPKAELIRVNKTFWQLPAELAGKGTGIQADCLDFIGEIEKRLS